MTPPAERRARGAAVVRSLRVLDRPDVDDPVEAHLAVRGEVGASAVRDLLTVIRSVLAAVPTVVLVDASEVTGLDPSVLPALASARVRLRAGGHELLVCAASPVVRSTLEDQQLVDDLAPVLSRSPGGR